MTRLWLVRAGRQGERERDALEGGRAILGFHEVGDLSKKHNREAILAQLEQNMPEAGENRRRNFAAQLNQFVNTMQIGDLVILPLKVAEGIAIGEVAGNYQYMVDERTPHSRAIKWLIESTPRDTFKQDLRHSFGAFMTVCEISRNEALERVRAVIEAGRDPGPTLGMAGRIRTSASPEDSTEASEAETDIEDLANHNHFPD